MEVAFVETTLQNTWGSLEHEDPVLYARFLEFAGQHGYAEALETAKKTLNLAGLLQALSNTSDGRSLNVDMPDGRCEQLKYPCFSTLLPSKVCKP